MRCYFHLVNGHTELVDNDGVEVSDLEDAKVQAMMAVDELQQEYEGFVDDWDGWHLHIICQNGTLLYSFPLVKTLQ